MTTTTTADRLLHRLQAAAAPIGRHGRSQPQIPGPPPGQATTPTQGQRWLHLRRDCPRSHQPGRPTTITEIPVADTCHRCLHHLTCRDNRQGRYLQAAVHLCVLAGHLHHITQALQTHLHQQPGKSAHLQVAALCRWANTQLHRLLQHPDSSDTQQLDSWTAALAHLTRQGATELSGTQQAGWRQQLVGRTHPNPLVRRWGHLTNRWPHGHDAARDTSLVISNHILEPADLGALQLDLVTSRNSNNTHSLLLHQQQWLQTTAWVHTRHHNTHILVMPTAMLHDPSLPNLTGPGPGTKRRLHTAPLTPTQRQLLLTSDSHPDQPDTWKIDPDVAATVALTYQPNNHDTHAERAANLQRQLQAAHTALAT